MKVSIRSDKIIVDGCSKYKVYINGHEYTGKLLPRSAKNVMVRCLDDGTVYLASIGAVTTPITGVKGIKLYDFAEEVPWKFANS